MHLCSTILTLLLLAWMEQGSCMACNGKPLTNEKRELFALYDKIEAAVSSLLPSKELKDVAHDIYEKLKSKLCDVNVEGEGLRELIKAGNQLLDKARNKKLDINEIIAFLLKGFADNLENMIKNLMKTPNNGNPSTQFKF